MFTALQFILEEKFLVKYKVGSKHGSVWASSMTEPAHVSYVLVTPYNSRGCIAKPLAACGVAIALCMVSTTAAVAAS
jgi:hypothetical protein